MKKYIKDSRNYHVTSDGEILGTTGKVLKPYVNKLNGYCYIMVVYKDGSRTTHRVHVLVAKHFINNPEMKPQVNHIDGNKQNNHPSNLEWNTASENLLHKTRVLGKCTGESHYKACVTKDQVVEICEMMMRGIRNVDISRKLGVTIDTVNHIRTKASWSEITKDYDFPKSRGLSEATVIWICHKLQEGYKPREVFDMRENLSTTLSQIKSVKERVCYKDISINYNF